MNVLKIYTLNEENGTSTPFPNEYEQAEFDDYEYTASRMGGAPSITAKIKHRLCLDDLWTEKQYVEFRGCKYFVRDTPSSSKDNNDTRYEHDITFLHERFVLENVYMLDSVFTDEEHPDAQPETDKYVSNSTKVVFWGDIHEFVGRFNACLHAAGLQHDYQAVVKQESNGYELLEISSQTRMTVSINDDETFTVKGWCGRRSAIIFINCNLIPRHKYFVRKGNINAMIAHRDTSIAGEISPATETSGILTALNFDASAGLLLTAEYGITYDLTVSPLVVDLTELYGSGNEPETAADFAARLGYSSPDEIPAIKFGKTETIGVFKGYKVVVDEGVTSEETLVAFEDKFFSEALQEIFNTFKLPYYWVGNCCHIGLAPEELSEVFEYGRDYALLSIEKQNTNQGYCNRATGVGSSDNIPYYYPNVQAPDITIPHAVEGNKGITDDTSLSLLADENAMKRWNDMESVTDEESPWSGRAIAYIQGDGQGVVFENYFRGDDYGGGTFNYDVRSGCFGNGTSLLINPYVGSAEKYYWENSFLLIWAHERFQNLDSKTANAVYISNMGWIDKSKFFTSLKIVLPFKITNTKGGSRVEFYVKLEAYDSTAQTLEFGSISARGGSVSNVVITPISTGMQQDGRYHVVFDIFDIFTDYSASLDLVLELRNATAIAAKQAYPDLLVEGYYLQITRPVVSPCQGRWYREPLDDINKLLYLRDLSYWGLASTQTPVNGDRIVRLFYKPKGQKITPVSTVLMPTIYRDSDGKESFYNALNEKSLLVDETYRRYANFYKDNEGNYLEFKHDFEADNQRETKYTFDHIKPTIKDMVSVTEVGGVNVPMNMFLAVEYDNGDNDYLNVDNANNDAKYAHPHFFVKLPKTKTSGEGRDFNLFDSGDENGNEMLFSITSGACGGCQFKVKVDEDTKKNPVLVNADGSIMRDEVGNVMLVGSKNASGHTFQSEQQDTANNEVWVALEKETDTYGIVMPNQSGNFRVVKNDTFVILNIHLPLAYIEDAEDRLSKAIIAQMKVDNSERFSFSISFSRIYLQENPLIAQAITENSKIYVRYNGLTIPLYVSNYSFKMSSNNPLPEITVDLNNEVIIGKTYQKNAQGDVSEPISSVLGSGTSMSMPIITSEDTETNPSDGNVYSALYTVKNFISRIKDSVVEGVITFLRDIIVKGTIKAAAIEIGNILQGAVGLKNGVLINSDGDIFARNVYVEEGLNVPYVKFNRIMGILGYFVVSVAGGKIKEVEKDYLTDDKGNILYHKKDKNDVYLFDADDNPISTTEETGIPLYANSGWFTLDLEGGEIGSVDVGDMLLGFWHSKYDNATENYDGGGTADSFVRDGNIMLQGFQSVYFLIDEIDTTKQNYNRYHYILRCEQDTTWKYKWHPEAEMSFYGFGNQDKDKKDRQSIYIISREYSVRLINKNTWRYDENNIIEIHGKLDGFSMFAENDQGETYVKRFTGYGNVMGKAYIFGQIDQFERVAYKMEIDTGGDTFIGVGETKTLKFSVVNGYGVVQKPTKWAVTRSSSRPNDDKTWNALHKDFTGSLELTLAKDFYGIDRATFTVVATMSDERTAEMIVEV